MHTYISVYELVNPLLLLIIKVSLVYTCPHTYVYRLDRVTELLNIVSLYENLSLSRLDGLDMYSQRFHILLTTLKKKPYDLLEHRKTEFDIDFDDFKRQLNDLNVRLPVTILQCVVEWLNG